MTSGEPGHTLMPGPINAVSARPHHPLNISAFTGRGGDIEER
jgi:hypothetical protein